MTTLLIALFHFALNTADPHQTCEVSHRDPGVPATMYLYCAEVLPGGTEVVSVGAYVPDVEDSTP